MGGFGHCFHHMNGDESMPWAPQAAAAAAREVAAIADPAAAGEPCGRTTGDDEGHNPQRPQRGEGLKDWIVIDI